MIPSIRGPGYVKPLQRGPIDVEHRTMGCQCLRSRFQISYRGAGSDEAFLAMVPHLH